MKKELAIFQVSVVEPVESIKVGLIAISFFLFYIRNSSLVREVSLHKQRSSTGPFPSRFAINI
jgi:hypothetical protein